MRRRGKVRVINIKSFKRKPHKFGKIIGEKDPEERVHEGTQLRI